MKTNTNLLPEVDSLYDLETRARSDRRYADLAIVAASNLGGGDRTFEGAMRWLRINANETDEDGIVSEVNGVRDLVPTTTTETDETKTRPLYEIAREIRSDWKKVNYAAVPYLDAMSDLSSVRDRYLAEDGYSIVRYFLGNASGWRGPIAKRVKAELKKLLSNR